MLNNNNNNTLNSPALTIFIFICVYISSSHAEKLCAQYQPRTCLFGPQLSVPDAKCKPVECNFDKKKAFKCGFTETGTFSYTPEDPIHGCDNPFMSMRRARPSACSTHPTDNQRCCDPTLLGRFNTLRTIHNITHYDFQPISHSCRYDTITRGQVFHYLNHIGNPPIVVFGDSIMRQFFNRLVKMMRGKERSLDHRLKTHTQYIVCHEADAYRVAPPTKNGVVDDEDLDHLKNIISGFYGMKEGPGITAAKQALKSCTRRPKEFHYLHSPKYRMHSILMSEYVDVMESRGVKPIIVTSVGYWESLYNVPTYYLDNLTALAPRTHKIVVVSVPLKKVLRPEQYDIITTRNTFMKHWVSKQDPNKFIFLDFGSLSLGDNPPPLPTLEDKHYMCAIWWRSSARCTTCQKLVVPLTDNGDAKVPQIQGGTIDRINTDEDGQCGDETQRLAWQVLFNALVPGKQQQQ